MKHLMKVGKYVYSKITQYVHEILSGFLNIFFF